MTHAKLHKRFGKNVRTLREDVGMSQAELGELLDLTRASISNIERGKQTVTLYTLVLIMEIFRTKFEELLKA